MKTHLRVLIIILLFSGLCQTSALAASKNQGEGFPDFITDNADFYVTRIGSVPIINAATYRLKVTGLVKRPHSFTLEELRNLDLVELPLTYECIGNTPKGPLLSTAIWKGFRLYDLLVPLGLDEKATGVQYKAADGYYASHTLEQIKENGIIGALYMNGVEIPARHGFPLRFLNPGFYGVKQPAWVTEVKVIDRPVKDYWEDRGWDCSPPIGIDSTIFFPQDNVRVNAGKPLEVGGAAFGGTRVKQVELTTDMGKTWQKAEIVKSLDADNVWVFWKATLIFPETGRFVVNARATDIHGNVQQEDDPVRYDGTSDWPVLKVNVIK